MLISHPDVEEVNDLITQTYEEPENPAEHRAHIVNPPKNLHIWQEGMTAKEMVDIARNAGYELTALCGYTWVPKFNPENLDACGVCIEIAGQLMREMGE